MMLHLRRGSAANSLRIAWDHLCRLVSMTTIAVSRLEVVQPHPAIWAIRWNCLSLFEFHRPVRTTDSLLRLFRAATVRFFPPMALAAPVTFGFVRAIAKPGALRKFLCLRRRR